VLVAQPLHRRLLDLHLSARSGQPDCTHSSMRRHEFAARRERQV
jgi:hypothetical protein